LRWYTSPVTNLIAGLRRRTRRLWNYRRIARAVRGKYGLEIGGPSAVFSPAVPSAYIPPVYALAAALDNCNFATNTTWSQAEAGRTFEYLPGTPRGMQYIHDATCLASIADQQYDFLLASHVLEHIANPLAALREFHRVLRPGGAVLVIVPNPIHIFDHRRPVTPFAHLERDLDAATDESDLTHLDEILALHDLGMDSASGTPEQFRARCLRNQENRCMHHHVFNLKVLEQAVRSAGFRRLYQTDLWGFHLLTFAERP
jgi:SAM-dependent methyltransferase